MDKKDSDGFFLRRLACRTNDSRAQDKDLKMDGHDGQPILDLVDHLHQLLGHAMPCQ